MKPRLKISSCPICHNKNPSTFMTIQDCYLGDMFNYDECPDCSAKFISNPPDKQDINHYYDVIDFSMRKKPGFLFRQLQKTLFSLDLKQLTKNLVPMDQIIDWGAGDGSLSRHLKQSGFSPIAVDIFSGENWDNENTPYIQFNGNESSVEELVKTFQAYQPKAIVFRHSLEHVYDPSALIRLCSTLNIKWVLIILPNADSFLRYAFGKNWCYWDPPRHLFTFNRKSLNTLASNHSYKITDFRTYGIDEVVFSFLRFLWTQKRKPRQPFNVRTPLSALSSAFSYLLFNTVIKCLLVKDVKN